MFQLKGARKKGGVLKGGLKETRGFNVMSDGDILARKKW